MVVSVTLGFMLSAFVRQSEGFKKRQIKMVNFLFRKGVVFMCMCT